MLDAGVRLGPYQIEDLIGQGGMGEVYRAVDTRLGRRVAIKLLPTAFASDRDRIKRFEQEAQATAALSHPNILAIYDTGFHHDTPYLVMELLTGETLREQLASRQLPLRKCHQYSIEIARGLAAAHSVGIVHRDLKPENIFVTSEDRIKILDFGVAKMRDLLTATSDGETVQATVAVGTSPGVVVGTMGYMAPEQVRGAAVDHRTDIFALGVTLYEMFSGTRPFRGATNADTMAAILNDDPPSITTSRADIPPAIERVINRCLEKSPAARFQSAVDLAFAVDTLSSGVSSGAFTVDTNSLPRRRTWPWALAAASIPVAIVLGWFAARQLAPSASSTTPPTFTQLTFRRGMVRTARFTPDGQSVLYSASWNGLPFEIFSTRVDAPESRPMDTGSAHVLSVSRSGEVALALTPRIVTPFNYRATFATVPVVGGSPRELLEGIGGADWLPDGTQAAIIRMPVPDRLVVRVEFPIGKVVFETPSPSWVSHLRVSPDGLHAAFVHHQIGGADDGEIIVVDGNGARVVAAAGWSTIQGVAWKSNGEVFFTAAADGGNRVLRSLSLTGQQRLLISLPSTSTVQDVSADGSVLLTTGDQVGELRGRFAGDSAEQTFPTHDWPTFPVLSPSGRLLAFGESGEAMRKSGYGVYLHREGGKYPVRLGAAGGISTFSPDEKFIVSTSQDGTTLVVLPVGAGEIRKLARGNIERYFGRPAWYRDSQTLIFSAFEKGSNEARTYIQAVDAPSPHQLERVVTFPSPDGRYAVCRRGPARGICAIESDEFRALPGLADVNPLSWSPDGDAILAYGGGAQTREIFRINIKTGERIVMRTLSVQDPTGLITIGGPAATADGTAYAYPLLREFSQL